MKRSISILVHGGCGPVLTPDRTERARQGCMRAARAAYAVLTEGGSAVDAVVRAVLTLEDDPAFNAGHGSVLNALGTVECDAALMDGQTLAAGAVGALAGVPNPVLAARAVMERSVHILLVGEGARLFARDQGVPLCNPDELATPEAKRRFDRERQAPARPGTVGAVACDAEGHVAAATSTGGTFRKLPGRVGDSPLISCGTYAEDAGAAVSATGQGEIITKAGAARLVSERVRAGVAPEAAVRDGVKELARMGGWGGLIAVDALGRLGWACNSDRMSFAWVSPSGEGAEA